MPITIIIKGGTRTGMRVRRSEREKELQKEGWGSGVTEEQIDKMEFIEREVAKAGRDVPVFVKAADVDKVK